MFGEDVYLQKPLQLPLSTAALELSAEQLCSGGLQQSKMLSFMLCDTVFFALHDPCKTVRLIDLYMGICFCSCAFY